MSTPASNPQPDPTGRLIDEWFPCQEVDDAVKTPTGSGRSEKALFTWFASRPIAQARAAVLTTLLADSDAARADIQTAVLTGDPIAVQRLRDRVTDEYPKKPPVVLDIFSGRGIIPLEAARCGVTAIGTDLSPVAALAGLLLADYPLRDWSTEPPLPFGEPADLGSSDVEGPHAGTLFDTLAHESEPRLLRDVRAVLAEVQRRVASAVAAHYPGNPSLGGGVPWAYIWAVTIPCDRCKHRFPLLGSLLLRNPNKRKQDPGQHLRIDGSHHGALRITVHDGLPTHTPPFASAAGKRGKSARCPFDGCGTSHSLDVVKAKGFAGEFEDQLIAVAEVDPDTNRKVFREPRLDEVRAANRASPAALDPIAGLSAVPDEGIPIGNNDNVRASGYGYRTYGDLMNPRQSVLFAATARAIDAINDELGQAVSPEYAAALSGYAASNMMRQIRRSTRGANLLSHGRADGSAQNGCQVDHVFSSQSIIKHNFDYIEAGPASGPGTWESVSTTLLSALKKVLDESHNAVPARFRRASAISLPFRDGIIDAVVTDPPYYDMIAYADSSDLFYVWFKRALGRAMPELFGVDFADEKGLQDKTDEIIVKGRGAKGAGDPRSSESRYEALLQDSFREAKRVLKPGARLTVIFGHSDPEAWKRLLAALTDAGFVVTSSWPSRTETAVTGVATISVTVSIGCKVAPAGRPMGIAAQVDAAVLDEVRERCREWDRNGLALEDQQMASYGAALAIVGRYEKVITPNGEMVPLEHYMTLARKAVRSAVALRLDSLPLETFDPLTRFAVFWQELYGRSTVPKGESRFFAQSDELRLEDLRGRILNESSKGFALQYDCPESITPESSRFEVVRGMAAAWSSGSEAVAQVIEATAMSPTDQHLWAVADWLASKLPSSDPVSVALTAIKRNKAAIQASVNTTLQLGGDS